VFFKEAFVFRGQVFPRKPLPLDLLPFFVLLEDLIAAFWAICNP
jgi:hypothetical protein